MKKIYLQLKNLIVHVQIIFIHYFIYMGMKEFEKTKILLHISFFSSKLNSFIESIPKSKKNRRCYIHSLDKIKSIK
jgi:hypothetical protein